MPSPVAARQIFARAFLPKLFILALACAWFAPSYMAPNWVKGTDEQVMAIRPSVEGSPAALVAEHDCWTGEAPAGAVAGHVVVTVDNVTRYAGRRMTDRAIEQAVFGVDHGLTVHGFCA